MISTRVTVTSIKKDQVVIEADGETFTLVQPGADTSIKDLSVGDELILTLTRDTDLLNSILTDTDDQEESHTSQ